MGALLPTTVAFKSASLIVARMYVSSMTSNCLEQYHQLHLVWFCPDSTPARVGQAMYYDKVTSCLRTGRHGIQGQRVSSAVVVAVCAARNEPVLSAPLPAYSPIRPSPGMYSTGAGDRGRMRSYGTDFCASNLRWEGDALVSTVPEGQGSGVVGGARNGGRRTAISQEGEQITECVLGRSLGCVVSLLFVA